jgi:FAD/FMN-containing dehydrogenase
VRRAQLTPEALRSEFKGLFGTLLIDEPTRQAAGSDFGLVVHRPPIAVLKPGAPQDILKIVEFANQRGIQVAMRGQGHAMFGQAQVENGVVIDSSTLNAVRMVDFRGAPAVEAEAGALWGQVLDLAYAQNLTPRVNVDPGYLSVGGTLSTGGFGGMSWREGFQTDHVLELQVITGRGQLITCSDNQNSDLFNAALAGMGQCGIIVKAIVPLVPAPTHVRFFVLTYTDLKTATADMMALASDGRFDHLDGRSSPLQGGGFTYNLEGGAFFNAPNAPTDVELLSGLRPTSQTARIMTYVDYYRRQAPLPRAPHPWLYLCLPASKYLEYATRVFATPAEFAHSSPRFSVWRRASIKRPLARVPDEDLVVRFQCSRNPPASADMPSILAMNRTLYERARDLGGTRLTTSAIPFSQPDWIHHYGPAWRSFRDAKARFDPNSVLTPGPGIFSAS